MNANEKDKKNNIYSVTYSVSYFLGVDFFQGYTVSLLY